MTTRHDIAFDRAVNAVDDLGWDPSGDSAIDVPADDGVLVEVPPGEYVFEGSGSKAGLVEGTLSNWGLRGLGDSPRDVVFRTNNGESTRFIDTYHDSEGVLLENCTFDNTDERHGGDIGNYLAARDRLEVHDVDHVGFSGKEPHCRWSIQPKITTADGTGRIVRYRKEGPSWFVGHGSSDGGGGVFDHEGHLEFRECVVANQGGDGGLYTGKHPGSIVFRDCEFRNNDMAAIRTAAGSELRNCEIVVDWDDAHPDNVLDEEDTPTGTNGVYFSSAQHGKSGGGIYDCTIRMESTYHAAMAVVLINASDAIRAIHDTTVEVNVDSIRPVWVMDPREQRLDNHVPPERPWHVDVRGLTVTGSGDCGGEAAVTLAGRHDSTIDELRIEMPNAPAGVDVRDSDGVQLGAHDIHVDGPKVRGDVRGSDDGTTTATGDRSDVTNGGRSLRERLTALFER